MSRQLLLEHRLQEQHAGCLIACAQITLLYLGDNRTQAELARLMRLTGGGTPAPRITYLAALGYEVTYRAGSEADLCQLIDQGIPAIVFLATGDLPYWSSSTQHAVVFAGYDEEQVFLYDPVYLDAPKQVSWGDFMLAWSEFDYRYAVILPKQ